MMNFKNYYFSILIGLFFVMPTLTLAAYPTEQIRTDPARKDFVVGPGKQELILKPGQSAVVEITVSNRMGETRDFKLEVEDFKGSRDITKPVEFLGADVGPYSLKNYIKYPEGSFTLTDGTRARIPVTIKIPENSEPGGFYGSLLVSTVKAVESVAVEKGAAKAGIPINVRQGILFFVKVEGDVREDGKVTDFKILNDRKFFGNNEDVDLQIIFENNGSVHLNPYGSLSVKNFFGQEISTLPLEPWFAMPDSLRSREKKMNTGALMGRYSVTAHVYRGFGALDEKNSYDDKSLTFWVIPWVMIGWIISGLLVIILALRWIKKNFEFRRK